MDNVISLKDRRPPEPEDNQVMCEITVYADGDTTFWLSNDIAEVAQFNWLAAKLAAVMGTLIDEKAERTKVI
jgi:hypothetical protein